MIDRIIISCPRCGECDLYVLGSKLKSSLGRWLSVKCDNCDFCRSSLIFTDVLDRFFRAYYLEDNRPMKNDNVRPYRWAPFPVPCFNTIQERRVFHLYERSFPLRLEDYWSAGLTIEFGEWLNYTLSFSQSANVRRLIRLVCGAAGDPVDLESYLTTSSRDVTP